jgi:hypothetical protein
VGLFVVTLLILGGPSWVVAARDRARPIRVAVWLLYPALVGVLGWWFGGWQWYDVAIISGGILAVSSGAIRDGTALVGFRPWNFDALLEGGEEISDERKALRHG